MTRRGRPLRFLALVMVGWIGARVALLWPHSGSLGGAIEAVVPLAAAEGAPPSAGTALAATPTRGGGSADTATPARELRLDPMRVQAALLNLLQFDNPEYVAPGAAASAPAAGPFAGARAGPAATQQWPRTMAGRWSASAWLSVRPGTGLGAAPGGGQLGGSQAGARLTYLLDGGNRIALYGRLTAPLGRRGKEAAAGVEWQPTSLPMRLIAEQRVGLDGVRGGPGVGLVGGVDEALGGGFRVESYAQAGAIARERIEPYADGAARATRTLAEGGGVRLALGGGAWGGVQRDAARLDLGPSATVALPLGDAHVRVALDWRQRVAGDALPGSGLALTIGSDF